MKKRRWAAAITEIFLLVTLTVGCRKADAGVRREGIALDTVVSVTLYDTADTALLDECFALIQQWETQLSCHADGDIGRLNAAKGAALTVAPETAQLLSEALSYSRLTDGAFDVTLEPVTRLWDFKKENAVPPAQDAVKAALAKTGAARLHVEGTTVRLLDPAAGVDLGGIAKGYIADRLADYLRKQGVGSALLDLGGNIYALGSRNGGDFRIGIRDPRDENSLVAVVTGQDCSVVTSGSYERGFTYQGCRYHHILDPATGYPAQTDLLSVTVVSPRSVDGDALATACFVLGKERGLSLIASLPETEALFVTKDGSLAATEGLRYTLP